MRSVFLFPQASCRWRSTRRGLSRPKTLLIAFSALLTAHTALGSDIYFIDKNHSNVGFLIRHLFTKVPGRFTDFSGQISFDEANPEQSTVEVKIKTASVNTDNDLRDKDLRSPNFFDVERFPEITFRSKSVKATGQNTFDVTGDLTIHGVTKEVILKVDINFDPLVLPNGIAASDDPVLSLRSATYSQSFTRREGEHRDPSAVSPAEIGQ